MLLKRKIACFAGVFILIFGALFFFASAKPKYPWYETVSMYHVLVKSFFDANNDGKGDLEGLTGKLDYIKSLNVNTLHMLPITPALNNPDMPRSHYGYEITDFTNIHPDYGTIDDFKKLVKEAHKRGIHIVLDFITTVFSVQHPFFQDILHNPNSRYKNWIIRADEIPDGDWMNFNDYSELFESQAWKPLPFGGYYYSLWGASPYLDYHNPEVQDYILSVIDFWLDLGVDGFRIDATKHLFINGAGQDKQYHQPENFEFWKRLRRHITEKYGTEKALIAETIPIPNDIEYVAPNREMFDLMFDSTFINDVYPYSETDINRLYSASYLHSFFDNAEVFKTTKLQDRLVYHSDHDGARLATRLSNPTDEQLKLAASLLILTPAHVKLYAGDEIGIKGFTSFDEFKDKWFHATLASMAWDDSENGGFTTSENPVIPITDDYPLQNVKKQEESRMSLLNHYRALMKLKNDYPQYFFKGVRLSLPTNNDKVYAYLTVNGKNAALAVMNLSPFGNDFSASLPILTNQTKIRQIFGRPLDLVRTGGNLAAKGLKPYHTYVFEITATNIDLLLPPNPKQMAMKDIALDSESVSEPHTAYRLESSGAERFLRIKQGQGTISLSIFEEIADGFIPTFTQQIDTEAEDVLLPVYTYKTVVAFNGSAPIRFGYEQLAYDDAFAGKLKKYAENPHNESLRALWAGKDDNFLYFKIDKAGYALPPNNGLDFVLLLGDTPRQKQTQSISFWRLPAVSSDEPFDALVLFERHIRTGRFQTQINDMRSMGVAESDKAFIYEAANAFYAILSRRTYDGKILRAAPFVWSAGGNWGDTPPIGKPVPIIERLTAFPDKNYDPDVVSDWLEIK